MDREWINGCLRENGFCFRMTFFLDICGFVPLEESRGLCPAVIHHLSFGAYTRSSGREQMFSLLQLLCILGYTVWDGWGYPRVKQEPQGKQLLQSVLLRSVSCCYCSLNAEPQVTFLRDVMLWVQGKYLDCFWDMDVGALPVNEQKGLCGEALSSLPGSWYPAIWDAVSHTLWSAHPRGAVRRLWRLFSFLENVECG